MGMVMNNQTDDDWCWCPSCYRCFLASEVMKNSESPNRLNICPYADCGHGTRSLNYWAIYRYGRLEVPEIPERNKRYGLYDNIDGF
jgi:hypothetical protein